MLRKLSAKLRSKKQSGIPSPRHGDDEDDDSTVSYAESLFPIDDGEISFASSSTTSTSNSSNEENRRAAATWAVKSFASSSIPEGEIDLGPAVVPEYEQAEEEFLDEYEDYFHHLSVDSVRREQYPNLELQRIAHLDYAASPLFSRYQVQKQAAALLEEVPSSSPRRLYAYGCRVQDSIMGMLNASCEDYALVITTGMEASMRLFASAYRFGKGAFTRRPRLVACQGTHNAVISCSACVVLAASPADLCIPEDQVRRHLLEHKPGVFAFPAQSELSGAMHPLAWIDEAQKCGWDVLLDVSSYLPSCGSLDLSAHQPDVVAGSLYHMVGYPSGLAFLLVARRRRELWSAIASKLRDGLPVMFPDDGSISSVTLSALAFGLDQLESVGLHAIQKRVACLASWLRLNLRNISHAASPELPLVKLYGPRDAGGGGGGSIVVFNLVDSTGNTFPASIVQRLARRSNIFLGISKLQPEGFCAVRASLGIASNFHDAYRLLHFLLRFRDEEYMSVEAMGFIEEKCIRREAPQ